MPIEIMSLTFAEFATLVIDAIGKNLIDEKLFVVKLNDINANETSGR